MSLLPLRDSSQPAHRIPIHLLFIASVFLGLSKWTPGAKAEELSIATFQVDVSPPVGSPLAYDPTKEITGALSLKGILILPQQQAPIVLVAIDWLGVANSAQDEFRKAIAQSVNTTVDRIAVHALHQHDAPRCDLSAADVLQRYGLAEQHFDREFIHDCIDRAAVEAEKALKRAKPITDVAFGRAKVRQVASNRRMLGPDGKVHTTRYTACRDPKIRQLPVGVIDPWLRTLVFLNEDQPQAVLSFYATHPQSYYRTGQANPDFPGMARDRRQADTGVFHMHFNGAGGNIGAGKYNDGSVTNRKVLADKMYRGMQASYEAQQPIRSPKVNWLSEAVPLVLAKHLNASYLKTVLEDATQKPSAQLGAAKKLAILERKAEKKTIDIHCLSIGPAKILLMPGELFVEYQIAAQEMLPDSPVLLAAYGDYGTGYIGTRVAYSQGGYEVSERASNVAPEFELVLIQAMRNLLGVPNSAILASDFTETQGPLP